MTTLLSRSWSFVALCGLCAIAAPSARAQTRTGGFELALFGSNRADIGGMVRVEGIAYAVSGLATLSPLERGSIVARVTRLRDTGDAVERETLSEVRVAARQGGRFSIEVPAPVESVVEPMLEIDVGAQGGEARKFWFPLVLEWPLAMDLLTDRARYEAGETIRVWSRVTQRADGTPKGQKALSLEVTDGNGRVIGTQRGVTAGSGVAVFSFVIPRETDAGALHIGVRSEEVSAARDVTVGRRTVERLFATVTIDQEIVAPGAHLTGRVRVTAPSGAAVRGARVELSSDGVDATTVVMTGADGSAAFDVTAPAYLSGEVGVVTLRARASHPAHGAIGAAAPYTVSRVDWVLSARAETGALVPEVEQAVFLSVTDPKGRPAPAGLVLRARGLGIARGEQEVTTDAHGIAELSFRVPRAAAAMIAPGGGACGGTVATTFEVEIAGRRVQTARLCAEVAKDAVVAPHAVDAVVRPGGALAFEVRRRESARGLGVLGEALVDGRAIGWTWISPSESRGSIALPAGIQGVVVLRVRPLAAPGARAATDRPGATSTGVGASAAVLVRAEDAFALELAAEQPRYQVRETARVTLRPSRATTNAYAALVVRDLAMHGGEGAWDVSWMQSALDRATTAPGSEASGHLLRAALATLVFADAPPAAPPPSTPPIYKRGEWVPPYVPEQGAARGDLRDPIALREEMLRRQAAQTMVQLESILASLDPNGDDAVGIVSKEGGRVTFDPDVLAHLVEAGNWGEIRTLGDVPLRVGMLAEADPNFSYDAVARRVARLRLVRLLAALTALTDPDDANAARVIFGEPPERWLSKLLALELIEAVDLVDPWGHAFQLRPAGTREPVIVVAQRAPGYELISAGPDGAFGTGDDVRDPFARVLPKGSPYAIASGEDALMERLAAMGPGPRVLAAMLAAYSAESIEAADERRESVVGAGASEGEMMDEAYGAATEEMPMRQAPSIMMNGQGAGAGPSGAIAARMRAHGDGAELDRSAPEPVDMPATSPLQTLGELVRERFPATLFFVGEIPLTGARTVDVPLQDALTTYRVEAIAWSSTGWTTGASAEIHVDRDTTVDAPVPPFAIEGDVLRLPVRVGNRSEQAVQVRIDVSAEGVDVTGGRPVDVEVPAGDAIEKTIEVRVGHVSDGHLVVRAVRARDGAALDAVRRPLTVLRDGRLVHAARDVLIEGEQDVAFVVPEGGADRGLGALRIARGTRLFGDPSAWTGGEMDWAAWTLAFAGESISDGMRGASRAVLGGSGDTEVYFPNAGYGARAVAVAWSDPAVDDERIRAAFRAISSAFPESGPPAEPMVVRPMPTPAAEVLLALSPAARSASRPQLRGELVAVLTLLSRRVEAEASAVAESPELHARAAAAIGWALPDARARAEEFLRRAERGAYQVEDTEWIEPDDLATDPASRVRATAYLGLARVAVGSRGAALKNLRLAVALGRGAERWPSQVRGLASALGGVIAGSGWEPGAVRVVADGQAVAPRVEGDAIQFGLPGIGAAGAHTIKVSIPSSGIGLGHLTFAYGVPWTTRPAAELPVEIAIEGDAGSRDGRSALRLALRNRGARVLSRPVVEIDMPAGAELDEATRQELGSRLRSPAVIEGRVVRLALRPIGPGGYVRLPIALRWSVGGTLRGLGAVIYDEAMPETLEGRAVGAVASRAFSIADRGVEPAQQTHEQSPEPAPPPRPIPLTTNAPEVTR